jgi:hypothetical protein
MNWLMAIGLSSMMCGVVLLFVAAANGMAAEHPKVNRNIAFALTGCCLLGIGISAGAS